MELPVTEHFMLSFALNPVEATVKASLQGPASGDLSLTDKEQVSM